MTDATDDPSKMIWVCCDTCEGTGNIDDPKHWMHPNNSHDRDDETWCLDCGGDGGWLVEIRDCPVWKSRPTRVGVWIEAVAGRPRRLVNVLVLDQPWPSSSKWFGPIPEVPQ